MLKIMGIIIVSGAIVFFLDKYFGKIKQTNNIIDEESKSQIEVSEPIKEEPIQNTVTPKESIPSVEQPVTEIKKTTRRASSKKKSND